MLIPHFGPHQADVYLPTMVALAIAGLAVAVPLVLAPALSGVRGAVVRGAAGVVVLVAVAAAVVLAVPAHQVLAAQVPAVQQDIRARYGVELPVATVGRLVDGDTVKQLIGSDSARLENKGGADRYVFVRIESAAKSTRELPVR